MRINSEFKDYYDVVMAEGQDQTQVYQRHKREAVIEGHYPFYEFRTWRPTKLHAQSYSIGFCGKIYPVIELAPAKYGTFDSKEAREHRKYCYSLKDVDAFVEANFDREDVEFFGKNGYNRHYPWGSGENRRNFEIFFKHFAENQSHYDKVATKYFEGLTPVFVAQYKPVSEQNGKYSVRYISSGIITYNSPLRQLDFVRIFPPYQAFQEISMWLANQAVPMKPIPEMSNEIKIASKGFDKFSFRKDKSKK
jgi:hypothetical protein